MKKTRVGFAILSHGKALGLSRLVARLHSLFENPPITIHHDFSQGSPDLTELPTNTHLIEDWAPTNWGRWNLVDAMMKACIELSEREIPPDWVVNLSESDYPAASAKRIIERLEKTPYDAHIHHERICTGMENRSWHHVCRHRYMQPSDASPFNDDYLCFAGEFWFIANSRAIRELIDQYNSPSKLRLHLEQLDKQSADTIPDECYFATTLANSRTITTSANSLRFINWEPPTLIPGEELEIQIGPTVLNETHLDAIRSSGALFIRKVHTTLSQKLLDLVDSQIDQQAASPHHISEAETLGG